MTITNKDITVNFKVPEDMIKNTQDAMARAVNAVKGAKTKLDFMRKLYEEFFNRPDDPSFEEWLEAKLVAKEKEDI